MAADQIAEKAVQLDTAVVRAGNTAGTKAARIHVKVASIFLDHNVRRKFRRPEDAVHILIQREGLSNSLAKTSIVAFPTSLQLRQRNAVWSVAIYLICAH